ncbi:DUF5337 family protein [Falsirhodobacter algicola]|uniref:Uncharacterized protein n=1 Tax=Falsirhodobacter algicola TaxID=2692330 RepID=A0A8J8SKK8_9RHOB|nr:DUF5337 family protein [Falsirhodobacter algicola]QUS35519.1 hypothetical protein GR316_04070 [Falsirhodobacter algicola]
MPDEPRRSVMWLAAVALSWCLVQWLGRHFDWSPGLMLVFDILALCGFVGGIVLTARVLRGRQV